MKREFYGANVSVWCDNVRFPERYRPLPPGYRVMQLDSGHFLWVFAADGNFENSSCEGPISWDRYWVRRCAFAHAEKTAEGKV